MGNLAFACFICSQPADIQSTATIVLWRVVCEKFWSYKGNLFWWHSVSPYLSTGLGKAVLVRERTVVPVNTHIRFCVCHSHPEWPSPLLFQELQVTVRQPADSAFSIIIPNFPIELSHDLIHWLHLESISIVQLLQLQELIVAKHIRSSPIAMHWSQKGRGANFHFLFSLWLNHHPKSLKG